MNIKYLILLFLLLPLLISCRKENAFDCVKSTGKISTETRNLAPFHTLKIEDDVPIVLVPDTAFWVEITAGENLLSSITTEVSDSVLKIRNYNTCNWVRSYNKNKEIRLHLPTLYSIYHNGFAPLSTEGLLKTDKFILHQIGAGDIYLELEGDYIWLDMYEVGNLTLKGQVREMVGYVWGLGKLQAAEFKTAQCWMQVRNGGDATVNVSGIIAATLTNRGNLYYYGNPEATLFTETGSGRAIAKE